MVLSAGRDIDTPELPVYVEVRRHLPLDFIIDRNISHKEA